MTGADIYMKTCKEKALEWNVSPRSVNDMCKKGRIQGAIKEKGSWFFSYMIMCFVFFSITQSNVQIPVDPAPISFCVTP